MKLLIRLAARSAWNRRFTLVLMLIAIALSSTLLLGIERVRLDMRDSFSQSVSGTDLVVGARSSPVQLMLYSIFHLGGATNNMGWDSARKLAANPAVAWTIPLSLGDSHRGFPVLGTTGDFFTHFHYGSRQPLVVADEQQARSGLSRFALHQIQESLLAVGVQRRGRFIGDDDFRTPDQRARRGHPLLLADRQLRGRPIP